MESTPMSKNNVNPNHYTVAGRERQGGAAPQMNARQAAKRTSVKLQGADARGKRSTAQKRTFSRDDVVRLPTTGTVVGVFGRELSRRRPKPRT
jgi:hypothetical protein